MSSVESEDLLTKFSGLLFGRVVTLWRESLATKNAKAAQSLANPADYENLFPGLQDALKTEQFLTAQRRRVMPASSFPSVVVITIVIITRICSVLKCPNELNYYAVLKVCL